MRELAATVRDALARLAAADRSLRRFGAARHRYELAPPRPDLAIPIEDLAAFVAEIGSGGAGPYHGWLPIERALAAPLGPPPGAAPWQRALPIAHLGCGYAAVLPLDGEGRGEIWLDARSIGLVRPIHPSFTTFYLDWLDRLARNEWPDALVPAGVCALPNALSGYLAGYEQELGIAEGTLDGEALRDALGRLGPGAIAIGGEPPLFARGDLVDPCLACARLVENLGLPPSVLAPGVPPVVARS